MNTINKDDFLRMVRNQQLEVLTSVQLQVNTGAVRGFLQKALTTELTDVEKSQANQLITDIGQFDCWCVLRDDFTKAVVYTRPAQVEWSDVERGEFDEVIKARGGVYKPTAENKKLGRVGQKYGESKDAFIDDLDKKVKRGEVDKETASNLALTHLAKNKEKNPSKKSLPEKGTPEWHKLEIAKRTVKMNPAMAGVMGGSSIEEAKKILAEYDIKSDEEPEKKEVKLTSDERNKLFELTEYTRKPIELDEVESTKVTPTLQKILDKIPEVQVGKVKDCLDLNQPARRDPYIAVSASGKKYLVDPQGFEYARYVTLLK